MLDQIFAYCQHLPGSTLRFPFGPETLVYSVEHRMFALIGIDHVPLWINLKCDPVRAIELREQYAAIRPGYHMNKRHWNTLVLDGSLPQVLINDLIVHSYRLVIAQLPRRNRHQYEAELSRVLEAGQ